ncbi:MAG: hypothetical protein JXQ23_06060 [Clostridia bacterium]|nr:hypothetical protein [Clostridia bacterium]
MFEIVHQVPDLYTIVKLKQFRKTPGVSFDVITSAFLPRIDSVERVMHESYAFSPGMVDTIERPWYMHPYQDDHLLVLQGTREVDVYTKAYGKIVTFTITPHQIFKDGALFYDGDALMIWPRGVFHRVSSKSEGSSSINLAVHYPGFSDRNNFNIYSLNTLNGDYKVIREGHLDQHL